MSTRYLSTEITSRSSDCSVFRKISSNCRAWFLRNNRKPDQANDKSIFVPWNVARREWKLHAYYSLDFCISASNYFSFSLFKKISLITYINVCEDSCITRLLNVLRSNMVPSNIHRFSHFMEGRLSNQ